MGDHNKLPYLQEIKGCHPYEIIKFTEPTFTIGRGLQNSFVIPLVQLSRTHCKFSQDENGCWQVTDTSQFGTIVNNQKIERFHSRTLKDGDTIKIGPLVDRLIYRFTIKDSGDIGSRSTKIPIRSPKQIPESESEISKELMTISPEKSVNSVSPTPPAKRSKVDPNLETQLKELQLKLAQTESANKEILAKLKTTETENRIKIRELQKAQELEKEELLARLQEEVQEKEREVREKLEREIFDLQEEKNKIERNIASTLEKQNAESEELLKQFREELSKVKTDMNSLNSKKQALEHQLQHAEARDQIGNKELFMKEKNEILNNFSNLMENELQCSICNELFVLATTLNCMHTFCSHCIDQWKQKKNECPVCRTSITASNRTLAVDNFIDKVVESLAEDLKEKRKELVAERKSYEDLAQQKNQRGNKRRRSYGCSHGSKTSKHCDFHRNVIRPNSNTNSSSRETPISDSLSLQTYNPNRRKRQSYRYNHPPKISSDSSFDSSNSDHCSDWGHHGRHCNRCGDDTHSSNRCPYFDSQLNILS